MSAKTGIEWTTSTWNPLAGCTHVSPGCGTFDDEGRIVAGGCYAARDASTRLARTPAYGGLAAHGRYLGIIRLLPDKLDQPLRWRTPRMVFVNSMSDLFHDQVPDDYICRVFAVMAAAQRHTFQVLTKRHARMRALLSDPDFAASMWQHVVDEVGAYDALALWDGKPEVPWPLPNVWLGVSVEDQQWADIRIPALLATPAALRFLSCEPLLGPIDLDPWRNPDTPPDPSRPADRRLGWVIAGGESGPLARPMHPDWPRAIRDQCANAGVPFFFKQWGEWSPVDVEADAPELTLYLNADGATYLNPRDAAADATVMRRRGKRAGDELDGRFHHDFPPAPSLDQQAVL